MLYLYKDITPNYGANIHYYFFNVENYVETLGDAFLSFDEDRYTINSNTAEVYIPTLSDINGVTYIAWNYDGTWRFYHVRSSDYQSGYARFTLDVDLWGTYIALAKITNIRVNRCNRNIGIGAYDPIVVSQSRSWRQLGEDMTNEDLSIVFVVAFATGQSSILENKAATTIGVYAEGISNIFPESTDESPQPANNIDNAIEMVGGIFSVLRGSTTLDANVIKAYIVPTSSLIYKSSYLDTPVFNTITPYFTGSLIPDYEVAPSFYSQTFDFEIDPDYQYTAGTRFSGLELSRVTGRAYITYDYIYKQDGLEVVVRQGDKSYDITNAFSVGLTSNDGNFTTYQQIARTLQTVGSAASGAFQIASGGAGVVSGALTIGNALQGTIQQGNARYTPSGDGVSTFRKPNGEGQSPYLLQRLASVDDERAHASLFGAAFNQQIEAISDLFDYDYLIPNTDVGTFVAADIRINGVPVEAQDLISSVILRGVYLEKI